MKGSGCFMSGSLFLCLKNNVKRLNTILFVIFFGLSSMILFIGAVIIKLLTCFFDRNLTILHYYTQLWAAMYLKVVPSWKVTIKGTEKLNKNMPCIYISNHQSYFDIMAISCLHIPFKWVAKLEVFKAPFIGWNMRLNNYIELKRGNKKSIQQMIANSESAIDQGNSILFFPEGTRSKDGSLQRFMTGAFSLAQRKNLPIVPIVIKGTKNILQKNGNHINFNCDISIEVLDTIPTAEYAGKRPEEIADKAHQLISRHIKS